MPSLAATAAFILLSIACRHDSAALAATGPACGAPGSRAPSAYAVLWRGGKTDSLATVTICLTSDTSRMRIAGYHGELAMAQGTRIVRVERPVGGTRIENTTMPGRVSFAGVAANGFASGPVLVLTVGRVSAADEAQIRLTMLDVTDLSGHGVVAQVHVDSLPRLARDP